MNDKSGMLLTEHIYWPQKTQFALDKDLYEVWTVFAVEDGRFSYSIEDYSGISGPGEIVICPPGSWFNRKVLEPLSFHFLQFSYHAEPTIQSFPFDRYVHTFKDSIRYTSTLRMLKSDACTNMEHGQLWKRHLLHDLITQLEMEKLSIESQQPLPKDPLMVKAQTLMQEQYDHDLQLHVIADILGLTPVQFTRRFRHQFAMTPSDFVIDLRIKHACLMLANSTLSIDDIARKCGYESGFYLSRIFLKKMNMRPSEYRKRYRV